MALPVLVLEQALIELSGRVTWELVAEVDGSRAFHVCELFAAIGHQLARDFFAGIIGIHELDDCFDFFPEVFVRDTEYGDVLNFWMNGEDVLGLLWIDVDAAADDHVRLAVGQIEKTVVVEFADITEGAPAVRELCGGGLLRIVVVLESSRARSEIDAAFIAYGDFIPFVVDDMHFAVDRLSDRALVSEPISRRRITESVAFGPCVIFVDDGSPPVEHSFLDLDRAGRGCVNREDEAAEVVCSSLLFCELEHPNKHSRNPLAMGNFVVLNRAECAFRIEFLHHDERRAEALKLCAVA